LQVFSLFSPDFGTALAKIKAASGQPPETRKKAEVHCNEKDHHYCGHHRSLAQEKG